MKIILCTFLLCITAVSVFGQSVELNGILGESIEFPAAVKKGGSLMHSSVTIGDVTSHKFTTPQNERFNGRLHWDSSTGFFSLSGLKMEDIGEYKVQNTDQNIITVFQLNLYIPVSKPHVSITHNEHPCTIECTAERGTGATLSWYREGEKKSLVSSRVASAPYLHLPETVERSGTYTCEARNSVSNETSDPLTVGAHCTAVFGQSVELNGIVGQSVKFPAAVKKGGFLMYSGVPIGEVDSGSFRTPRNVNYRGRLDWDSSTGFFSLSGLTKEDFGEYKVQNTDQNIAVFQLNVYAVSVFGQSVELNGIVGESVKFPAAVKKGGSLMYGNIIIGDVTSGRFTAPRNGEYSGRPQWDSSTGLFSLSGLKLEDSGEYKVQNTDQNIITVFQLNVYKDNVPVSKPHVSVTRNEYPCTLLCTAERGTGATLSWYREGEKKSLVSSRVESAPHLHLPESVERSGTHTCEAKNSVSRETSDPLTVGAHCTAPTSSSTIVAIIIAVVAVLIAVVFAVLYHRNRRDHTSAPSSEREGLKLNRGETA